MAPVYNPTAEEPTVNKDRLLPCNPAITNEIASIPDFSTQEKRGQHLPEPDSGQIQQFLDENESSNLEAPGINEIPNSPTDSEMLRGINS